MDKAFIIYYRINYTYQNNWKNTVNLKSIAQYLIVTIRYTKLISNILLTYFT